MTTLAYDQRRKPVGQIKDLLNRAGHRIAVYLASYSVAMAWSSGRRADLADLKKVGFTRELEDQAIAATKGTQAS